MAEVLADKSHWTVSARAGGEVLAVQVGESGLQMGFVGRPQGLDAGEVRGWLSELIGMSAAAETQPVGGEAAPGLPIPRSLHQALTGLLFLQSEVWGHPSDRVPMALVVVEWGDRVALGWSGSGRVTLTRSGQPAEPAWITVRDDQGREARALVADGEGAVDVRAIWSATGPDGVPLEGVLEAAWPGRGRTAAEAAGTLAAEHPGPEAGVCTAAAPEGATGEPSEPAAEIPSPVEPAGGAGEPRPARRSRPFWHFRGWMDRLGGSSNREETVASEIAAAEDARAEEAITPLPTRDLEPIAHDVPGVPDLLPEPAIPAASEAGSAATESAAEPEASAPEVPAAEPAVSAPEVPMAEVEEPGIPVEELLEQGPASTFAPPAEGPVEPTREPIVESATPDAGPAAARRAPARRLEWPEEEPRRSPRLRWRRSWTVAAVVVGLFAFGWSLGHLDVPSAGRAVVSAFEAIGLGPARFEVAVTSRPAGAWIAVDGTDQTRRTPATLTLRPGRHEITLSLSDEGGSTHAVEGKRGERVTLDVALWGGLRIDAPPGSAPLSVTVDGMPRGYAPLVMDRLSPGIHRLQFSGPGVAPWEQTVEVHVNRTAEVLARPVVAPPTGVLEVRARLSDETGAEPLAGAAVRIDGQQRGVTPLRLELPRGPHSVRVSYQGEMSAVQVIDLPGGNQRYATLDVGLDLDAPRLSASLPRRVPLGSPTVLTATLDGAREGDAREMWLHVRTPEGAWRRYAMSLMKGQGGLVGVAVFPTDLFDRGGRTSWYVSALAPTGDEYFTEIQPAQTAAD